MPMKPLFSKSHNALSFIEVPRAREQEIVTFLKGPQSFFFPFDFLQKWWGLQNEDIQTNIETLFMIDNVDFDVMRQQIINEFCLREDYLISNDDIISYITSQHKGSFVYQTPISFPKIFCNGRLDPEDYVYFSSYSGAKSSEDYIFEKTNISDIEEFVNFCLITHSSDKTEIPGRIVRGDNVILAYEYEIDPHRPSQLGWLTGNTFTFSEFFNLLNRRMVKQGCVRSFHIEFTEQSTYYGTHYDTGVLDAKKMTIWCDLERAPFAAAKHNNIDKAFCQKVSEYINQYKS